MSIQRVNEDNQELAQQGLGEIDTRVKGDISREIAGLPTEILIYQFKQGSTTITGITHKGALALAEAAARWGRLHLSEAGPPTVEDRGDTWFVMTAVTNRDTGVTWYGIGEAPKAMQLKGGGTEDDKFAVRKAHAFARRNAILSHFSAEEKLIQRFAAEQAAQNKTVLTADATGALADARREQLRAEGGGIGLGPEEIEHIKASRKAAGITDRQMGAHLKVQYGTLKYEEVPASQYRPLLKWIEDNGHELPAEAAPESEPAPPVGDQLQIGESGEDA